MFKRNRKADTNAPYPLPKLAPFRKRSNITVLDFEGGLVRVVQAAGSFASARITRVELVPLEVAPEKKGDAKVVGAALKTALESQKLKAREVIFTLPRSQVVLRPLQVPLVSDFRELASIINFQISKDLPFRIEDAVVDFKILRGLEAPRTAETEAADAPEQRLEVLVGAVQKSVVEFYQAVSREAGLKLDGLGLRPVGYTHYVRQSQALPPDAAALIVGLRTDETTLDVVDQEKLVFSRVATATYSEDPETRAAFIQAVQIEAIRSLHSYDGLAGHHAVRKILILGQTGLEQEVAAALSTKLGLPADFPKLPNSGDESSGSAAARGLALATLDGTGLPLDFEHPKKPAVRRNTKRTQLLVTAAAALVILFVLVGVRMNLVKKRLAIRQQVQEELSGADKKMPIYKRLKAQHKVVNNWITDEQNWLDHLAFLSTILPGADEIYLSAFTTTPQHLIRFSVQARSGELLAELDKKLRAAGYEVKPLSITPANDKHGYNFRTTVELSIPRKMKPDLGKAKAPPRPADDSPPKTASAQTKTGASRS